MTKNRIGNAVATLAAIVGMVLVITGAGQKGDDTRATPAPPGHIAPAVPGPSQAGPSARSGAPSPAPAPAPKDGDDGDDG